jgi:putative aminopeptidase FrvX
MNYNFLKELVQIDSPTGYTEKATSYIFKSLKNLGLKPAYTNKGAIRCTLGKNPVLAIAAHVDTLGAIVSGFKSDGTLKLSLIGGLSLTSAEGEYVTIYTMKGKSYTGTLLYNNPSSHANNTRESDKRSIDTMHVRVDELVKNSEDLRALGINIGDFICFEPRYRHYENGFIKSRFMDNKAGCHVLFAIAEKFKKQDIPVELFFSTYEEVGHGGTCGYSESIKELLVIDMGVLGDPCEGQETACSICVKDSSGPYDYNFRVKLVDLAEKNKISYKLDVYPYYGSDGSAALRAGKDYKVALIGPGVAASHGVERTHEKGIQATVDLSIAYIESIKNESSKKP